MPNADQAVAIARALGVSVEYLVTGNDAAMVPERFRRLLRDMQALEESDIEAIEAMVSVKMSKRREESKHA